MTLLAAGCSAISEVAPGPIFDHPASHRRNLGADDAGAIDAGIFFISILTTGQVMFRSSVSVGVSALAASALGFFGTASFFGSLLARREKKYSALDLAGIGAIALVLVIAAFGLMLWSGFSLSLDGVLIPGSFWVVVGVITALLGTKKPDAL
jgi:hypothetical protein